MVTRTPVVPLHHLIDAPERRGTNTPHGVCTAHFGDLRGPLLEFVSGSDVIVGCVAWVTENDILTALAGRPCALVVQKENWWKKTDSRGQTLARRYAALDGRLPASLFPAPLGVKTFRRKQVPNDAPLPPIACVGYGSGGHHLPLMHHKFVVRCILVDDPQTGEETLVPAAVWTGSFNFSGNASNSFENAVEIHDPTIAAAYLDEFALVASVSEPMNWRLSRPNPKGAGAAVFTPPPVPPKKTTSRVVKGAGKKRAASRKKPQKRTTRPRKAAA